MSVRTSTTGDELRHCDQPEHAAEWRHRALPHRWGTVAADNITLDLGGHGVVGFQDPRDGTVVGINLLQRWGMSVVNGTVCGFNAGIHIGGGSRNKVANIHLHDNIGPDNLPQFGDGIMIEHESSNNQIVHNVINHNGTCDGIGIYDPGSDRSSVVNNVVEITVGPAGHPREGIIINGTSGSGASTPFTAPASSTTAYRAA